MNKWEETKVSYDANFSLNLNDTTTSHKLQGVTKEYLIVQDWTYTHHWVYTVLSRVPTRDGVFSNKPLVYKSDSFKLP